MYIVSWLVKKADRQNSLLFCVARRFTALASSDCQSPKKRQKVVKANGGGQELGLSTIENFGRGDCWLSIDFRERDNRDQYPLDDFLQWKKVQPNGDKWIMVAYQEIYAPG